MVSCAPGFAWLEGFVTKGDVTPISGEDKITETVNDKGGGGVAKVGIGFSF